MTGWASWKVARQRAAREVVPSGPDTLARGRAFLDEGAACMFVPGRLDTGTVAALVDGLGRGVVSVLGMPATS